MRIAHTVLVIAACKAGSKQSDPIATAPVARSDSPTLGDTEPPPVRSVALPGGEHGIGFDDLRFAHHIGRVVAPGGGTGTLALIDPSTDALTSIAGFGTAATTGGHENGTTSADEGGGYLFAIDRTQLRVVVIDEKTSAIVGSAPRASAPDYVRWVDATRELWVTQPDDHRIEIFTLAGATPKHAAFIAVKGGPESLVIDKQRAFTHLWEGKTVAIDVTTRKLTATWPNGCTGSRGIALDPARGHLFVGCSEGRAVVLDTSSGKQLGSIEVGAGVDVIDFNPHLSHLYVPSARTATLSIVGVAADGSLSVLDTVTTASGAHCVTADDRDTAWVCDPAKGRLLAIHDAKPASR